MRTIYATVPSTSIHLNEAIDLAFFFGNYYDHRTATAEEAVNESMMNKSTVSTILIAKMMRHNFPNDVENRCWLIIILIVLVVFLSFFRVIVDSSVYLFISALKPVKFLIQIELPSETNIYMLLFLLLTIVLKMAR